jgi:hypothetical protein
MVIKNPEKLIEKLNSLQQEWNEGQSYHWG